MRYKKLYFVVIFVVVICFFYVIAYPLYYKYNAIRIAHKIGIDNIIISAIEILNKNPNVSFVIYDEDKFPDHISKLHPVRLIIRKEGLYIVLQDRFLSEKGLFVIGKNLHRKAKMFQYGEIYYENVSSSLYWYEL